MPIKSVIEAIRSAMYSEMKQDPNVFILGQDVGKRGGVFLATENLMNEFGEERVIDAPLSESAIIGIAIGSAIYGKRPIAEIQFADFMWPAFNQLVGEAAKARYGTNGAVSVPMVVRVPNGGSIRGGLYHSQSIEAHIYHTPGLKIVYPSTPYDAKGLLISAIRDNDPVVFLEHKKTYRLVKGQVPDYSYHIPIGLGDIKKNGKDITCITYGLMVHYCLEAAKAIHKEGIDVEVIDLRTLRPLDTTTIVKSVSKTSRVIIVHEDNKTGGIGAEISALIAETAFQYLDAPIVRVAGPDIPSMPYSPPLEEAFMPNTNKIISAMHKLSAY